METKYTECYETKFSKRNSPSLHPICEKQYRVTFIESIAGTTREIKTSEFSVRFTRVTHSDGDRTSI